MSKKLIYIILIVGLLLAICCSNDRFDLQIFDNISYPEKTDPANRVGQTLDNHDSTLFPGKLSVHFLDVGQGDAIFVLFPRGQTLLVDAGTDGAAPVITSYLQPAGVKHIDYLVATHPHQDHIGGMPRIIQSFGIGKVFMPQVTHNSATYENLLLAIKSAGKKITAARAGITLLEDENLKVYFVAPVGGSYKSLNNYSAVICIEYGSISFLLTGDAEAESEWDMIDAGMPLNAHVLKICHHGSNSSTTPEFLRAVSPAYAVISAGMGNDYGHPHQETLNILKKNNIITYRTDRDGTIVFVSDGQSLTVTTSKSNAKP